MEKLLVADTVINILRCFALRNKTTNEMESTENIVSIVTVQERKATLHFTFLSVFYGA